MNLHIFFIRIF